MDQVIIRGVTCPKKGNPRPEGHSLTVQEFSHPAGITFTRTWDLQEKFATWICVLDSSVQTNAFRPTSSWSYSPEEAFTSMLQKCKSDVAFLEKITKASITDLENAQTDLSALNAVFEQSLNT